MVLLINPGSFAVGVNEATVVPPVGLLYIASFLNQKGFKAEVYDAGLGNNSPAAALNVVKEKKPEIVGLRVYYYNIAWSRLLIEGIRQFDERIKIGVGGHVASYCPQKIMESVGADFAISGEGELSMLKMALNISGNKNFYEEVPGIFTRVSGEEYYRGPANNRIKNLDDLPYPDYGLVGGLLNYSSRNKYSPSAPIFTTRGCAFRCSFCSRHVFNNLVTFRSPENVIVEIKALKNKYAIRQIDILDDNFTLKRDYVDKILDKIIGEKLKIFFDLKCGIRVESLDEGLLIKMKKAGFYKIAFGIESADEKVLRLCDKQLDLGKLKKMATFAKKTGFVTSGFFIIGLPGETRESVYKSVRLAKDIGLDIANFCMATPYPGTELYNYVRNNGVFLFNPEGNYDFGFYGSKVFYTLPGMSEKEVLYRFDYAYRKFYTFPKVIKHCVKMRSFSELKWFIKAAISVFKGKMHLYSYKKKRA